MNKQETDRSAENLMLFLKSAINGGRFGEGDKSKAPRVTGNPIPSNHGAQNDAVLGKMLFEHIFRRIPGNASDKQLILLRVLHSSPIAQRN